MQSVLERSADEQDAPGGWSAYLATQSPDAWHRVARAWTCMQPPDVLFWIAKQPECDRATAQLMFHMASSAGMGWDPHALSRLRLRRIITDRWNAGCYTRDELGVDTPGARRFGRKSPPDASMEVVLQGPEVAPPTVDALLIDYLGTQGPDEWHRVLLAWDWDRSLEPLAWIAEQPGCDQATAQMMFHFASPIEMLAEAVRGTDYAAEIALCRLLAERWNAGLYQRNTLASHEDNACFCERDAYRDAEALIEPSRRAWRIEDSMFADLPGRTLDPESYAGYHRGIPPSVAHTLRLRGIAWP